MIPITPEYLRPHLLHRRNDSHKGDYGHLLIVAGCEAMPGAAVIVAKGFGTHVYASDDVLLNTTGGPGLAKGGSGDVLAGLIGGLLARGYPPADAAALGVWIHGRAGDVLSASKTAEAFDSRDLIDSLHRGFLDLYDE